MIVRTAPSIRTYHKGKVIFHEGQESKIAYMIKSGSVDIFKVIDKKKTVMATLRRGDIFGEMSLLANQKRTASAEASSFCELVVLTEEMMKKLLQSSPETVRKMLELLAKRVAATDLKASGSEQNDSFLALATILDLAYREFAYTPRDKQREIENFKMGLSVKSYTETVKTLAVFSNLEIESFLETVFKLRLIDMKSVKKGDKSAFVERYISIKNFEQFMPSLRNLYKQMRELGANVDQRMSFMSFSDLAQRTGSTPDQIYKKVIKEEMPENLLFFNREKVMEWQKGKDPDFFKKFRRPRKALEDLESVEDIIFIDNPTLGKALEGFNYYKISVLYSAMDQQGRDKLKRNIGKKVAQILLREPPADRDAHDSEVLECCDELLDIVRKLKGVK
ncbi:Crp/Fnr family transcriptional regulator [Desulfovibrio sp. JC022]|uniref:Crp/Fnr family transcriptional regulator n=1 Tax=Desulfovibrio sp. JC022 TaxID=2593642 RepID=UPI0013CFA1AF|nr:cyclic nucleotide-binding domain-containing protein [Desulfovibrio sp. JC022]NDV24475.1 cyclic nucleotide-binding domain-containing protein [Desulfovibrio sp. JC022]